VKSTAKPGQENFRLLKPQRWTIQNYNCIIFFVGVELGLSHLGSHVGKGCSKMGYRVTDILVHQRDKVTGPWRRVRNGEHHDLLLVTNKNEMGRSCGTMGKKRIEYAVLGAKYEGKRPVGRP